MASGHSSGDILGPLRLEGTTSLASSEASDSAAQTLQGLFLERDESKQMGTKPLLNNQIPVLFTCFYIKRLLQVLD